MTAVACPACGKTAEMIDRPLYCRGEGTFHNQHEYRMLTINELISKHASVTEAGYDTAAIRILRAMEKLING